MDFHVRSLIFIHISLYKIKDGISVTKKWYSSWILFGALPINGICYNVIMDITSTSNRYAVVDLEATGTGIDAKIIQIGIVIVENREIVETYSTDINPYELLDDHIKNLTGITTSS
jgi:DNA polymerase III epsilon subunit-like protein